VANDPKTDLVYAILALDLYNRGYGSGIKDLSNKINSAEIGQYTIVSHSNDALNSETNDDFANGDSDFGDLRRAA